MTKPLTTPLRAPTPMRWNTAEINRAVLEQTRTTPMERMASLMRQAQGLECPHCSSCEEHESNVDDSTYLCTSCGEQWDVAEVES